MKNQKPIINNQESKMTNQHLALIFWQTSNTSIMNKWTNDKWYYFQKWKMNNGDRGTSWAGMIKHRLSNMWFFIFWFVHFFIFEMCPIGVVMFWGVWLLKPNQLLFFPCLMFWHSRVFHVFIFHYWFSRGETTNNLQQWQI